ncbi:helix-turn-helix domain-containing protein [Salmonella enterica]|uniref:Helix-turn-helix domain-containing protein n=1 Tax=Salmonella enterica TaxID=28901 RepID=A0A5U2F941_SALER|nr:helix-turn-helix domain-containing protein [Salmonella enterica]
MKLKWNELVKARMKEAGVTQEKLGEMIGKTQGAVAHWLNGRREPALQDIANMMKALGIDELKLTSDGTINSKVPADTLEFAGQPKNGYIPVRGEAWMGSDGEFDMVEIEDGWIQMYSGDPDAFALRVKGDSMFPRINAGEYVVVEPNATVSPGLDVFVRTFSGKNLIKRLGYDRNGTYQLLSVNQAHPPLTIEHGLVSHIYAVAAIVTSARYLDTRGKR